MTSRFLAVDWGTTNLRAWVVDAGGRVADRRDFSLGISKLAPGEAARRFRQTVRAELNAERLPAILCGMIGSNMGWEPAPYFDCPTDLRTLASGLQLVPDEGPPVFIVPGLRCLRADGGPDVMRGEETQIFGWAAGLGDRLSGEHLVCQPGTHAKWVRMIDGRIDRFVTAMTGELFDLLSKHSVLQVRGPDNDDDAFAKGMAAAGDGSALASRLFTARARVVGGEMPAAAGTSYLSGLLIGAEVISTPALLGAGPNEPVTLIGAQALCCRYRRALEAQGRIVTYHDGDAAVLAGLTALFNMENVH